MTLSGEQVQQTARDAAAALEQVSTGRPFTPHLEVWKVRDKVFLIVTEDNPDRQIITVKRTRITPTRSAATTTRSPSGTTSTRSTGSPSVRAPT